MPNTFISLDVPAAEGTGTAAIATLLGSPKTFVFSGDSSPRRYVVEGSNDGGGTWDILVARDGTQALFAGRNTGAKTIDAIVDRVRVRTIGNARNTPAPAISMGASPAVGTNVFGVLEVPAANSRGAPFDLGQSAGPLKTFTLRGAIPTTARYSILASMDGTNFDQVMLFTSGQDGARSTAVLCRFLRVLRSGGGATPVVAVGAEGILEPGGGGGGGGGTGAPSELTIAEESQKGTSGTSEQVLVEYLTPLRLLASPVLGLSFACLSVQAIEGGGQPQFRVRLGGTIGQPDGTEIFSVSGNHSGTVSLVGNAAAFPRPSEDASLVKVTGLGSEGPAATLRGLVLLFHGRQA
jgi:hypothetical protein